MSDLDDKTVAYIADTARAISERLERDAAFYAALSMRGVTSDVAWIARQLAKIVEAQR